MSSMCVISQEQAALLAQMLSYPQPHFALSRSEPPTSGQPQQQQFAQVFSSGPASAHVINHSAHTALGENFPVHSGSLSLSTPAADTVTVPLQVVTDADSTTATGLQSTAYSGSSALGAMTSPGQHVSMSPHIIIGPSSNLNQYTALNLVGSSLDPSCSPSQPDSLMQSVTGSPSLDPSQRLYVAQRVKELQSQQGSPLSPERSASSSTMLAVLSPRSGDRRAASPSLRPSLHQPSMFSSPDRGLHGETAPAEADIDFASGSRRFKRPAKQHHESAAVTILNSEVAGSNGNSAAAVSAKIEYSPPLQPQRAKALADLHPRGTVNHTECASSEYELSPEPSELQAEQGVRGGDRLEMSSSAVELQPDSDSASLVSST